MRMAYPKKEKNNNFMRRLLGYMLNFTSQTNFTTISSHRTQILAG